MNNPATDTFEVVRSDAPLGAEIRGVNLAGGIDDTTFEAILHAWREHLVLIFRDQKISDHDLLAFAKRFGELEPPGPNPYGGLIYPEFPELNVISNIVEDGRPVGNLGAGEAVWHADMTYNEAPPKGAILYAVELPAEGGNTEFADMRAAYDTLAPNLKGQIDGLRAIHDASHNSAGIRRKGYEEVTDVRQTPGAHQPLVRTDPQTKRKSLFLGRRPRSYVVGLELNESEQLLDALWAHAARREGVFTHQWQIGDIVMWDNLSVLHRRDEFDAQDRRRLHRAQLRGEGRIH